MKYKLKIISNFWNKDSNVLFDYETGTYIASNVTMISSGFLYRQDKTLIMKKDYKDNKDYIATISRTGDEYTIHTDDQNEFTENKEKSLDDKLWIVIRSTYYNNRLGHKLREGDKIKLGKVMFKVCELKSDEADEAQKKEMKSNKANQKSNLNTNFYASTLKLAVKALKPKSSSICRICLSEDNEPEDPLISPCSCTGSVRFIHLNCIRRWLSSKIISKSFTFLTVHSFKNFECEICKEMIPEKIKFRNEVLSLVEYQKPESNYIILESISREKRENKYIYIIHMKTKLVVKLGRSNESDVRLTDISVSRNHASLALFNGSFYLQDNSSKFGTSVQLQNEIIPFPGKPIGIQSSKLFLIFALAKTCISWLTCYDNKSLAKTDYNTYLEGRQPYYYLKELDCLNVIDSNFTISPNDYLSVVSKKSDIIDNNSNRVEEHIDIQQKEEKENIKESRTANEESLLADLNNVKTRNMDVVRNNNILEELGDNARNASLNNGNSLNLINISKDEKECDFLLDRLHKKKKKRGSKDSKNKNIIHPNKIKDNENVTGDYDVSKTRDDRIHNTPKKDKNKINVKNLKFAGINSYDNKKLEKNLDYNSFDSEKLILKENKISVNNQEEELKENNLNPNKPFKVENLQKLVSNNDEDQVEFNLNEKYAEQMIDSIFSNSLTKYKQISQNNFINNIDHNKQDNKLIKDHLGENDKTEGKERHKNKKLTINKISYKISHEQPSLLSDKKDFYINDELFLKHSMSDPTRDKNDVNL